MRGCLSVVIIAAAFIVGVVWFGGPPLAATVVEATLTGAGFDADDLDITVSADPPLLLAVGRADRVEIEASDVRWNGLRAGSMSMRLDGVDFLDRTAATAEGRFDGVEIPVADGDPGLVGMTITGPARRAVTTITIDSRTINLLALGAFERAFGSRPDAAELVAPDGIRVRSGTSELAGTLQVEPDGALVVTSILGKVRLVEPDSSIPLRLTGLSIVGGGMTLSGTLDVSALLR